MIGGTGVSLVCGRNRSRIRIEYQEAVPEDGCSNWKRTSADDIAIDDMPEPAAGVMRMMSAE